MSAININPSMSGPTTPDASSEFDPSTAAPYASFAPGFGQRSDAITSTPWLPPRVSPGGGSGDPNATSNASGMGAVVNGFMNALTNLLSQLGAMLDGANGPSSQPLQQSEQTHYANASAGSVGDPHDSFDGTTGSGSQVAQKWDDMQSHPNLLSSDSFRGGYRVSTTASQPNARGATLNDRASVTTDGGQTSVGMNQDGSYDVSSFGKTVALTAGQAVHLSDGETVTLGADRSLTVDDRNARNGSISTTLRPNGAGGVDVTATANSVDLGGFLVDKSDGDEERGAWGDGYGTTGASYGNGTTAASYGNGSYAGANAFETTEAGAPQYRYAGAQAPYLP